MDLLNLKELKALVGWNVGACVSLFMPTHRTGAETRVDLEKQLQFHTRTQAPGTGERTAGFHGHDPADEAKSRVLRYFRQVNEGLVQVFRDERAPLVLAGSARLKCGISWVKRGG